MHKSYRLPFALLFLLCTACVDDEQPITPDATSREAVIERYADLVLDNYQAARADALTLDAAIGVFVAEPTAERLQLARTAWLAARESYGPTEAYRFANGPIDVIDGEEGPEGLLNSWPLDEAYIDYVAGDSTAGLINAPAGFPTLTKESLAEINGAGGEENVSVGYHAIEFLLWGQDLTVPTERKAGQRPYTDFVDGGTAPNADRRRAYLTATSALLLDHLQLLIEQWEAAAPYRTTFLALDQKTALGNMMTAIATLAKSELAGERIFMAYDNRDQEDEHSCFSDNTHRDIRLNFAGIRDVYLGRIESAEGPSLDDLVSEADTELGTSVREQLLVTEAAIEATAIPFDLAISNDDDRPAVLAAVTALRTLGDRIAQAGNAIGVEVGTE